MNICLVYMHRTVFLNYLNLLGVRSYCWSSMNFDAFVFELRTALNALQRTVDEVTEKLAQRVNAPTAAIASTLLFDGDRLTADARVRLQTGRRLRAAVFHCFEVYYM